MGMSNGGRVLGKKVMKMELPGTRKRGGPKTRYMNADVIEEDMKELGLDDRETKDQLR